MYEFCPEHGERFAEYGDFRKFWCRILECPHSGCPGYLEVADAKWPMVLLQLDIGVLKKLQTATEEQIEQAFGRLDRINYKTISSLGFEHTLLGCYRDRA